MHIRKCFNIQKVVAQKYNINQGEDILIKVRSKNISEEMRCQGKRLDTLFSHSMSKSFSMIVERRSMLTCKI